MRGQADFFDIDERLKQLSAKGDSLERLSAVVDFELFRADLELGSTGLLSWAHSAAMCCQ